MLNSLPIVVVVNVKIVVGVVTSIVVVVVETPLAKVVVLEAFVVSFVAVITTVAILVKVL